MQTKDTNQKYHGGSAIISIYNPKVEGTQYSFGRVKVQNGPDSIEVGWTISEIGIVMPRTPKHYKLIILILSHERTISLIIYMVDY